MARRMTEIELGKSIGFDSYIDMTLDGRKHLDRRIRDIAGDAARIALNSPDLIDGYNMNPVSVARAIEAKVIAQTFLGDLGARNEAR